LVCRCPPCRALTPILCSKYNELKAAGKVCEFIFVSLDRDEASFNSYHASMPFLALPFSERQRKDTLMNEFGVGSVPTLVLLDGKTGEIITKRGRDVILSKDSILDEYPFFHSYKESLANAKTPTKHKFINPKFMALTFLAILSQIDAYSNPTSQYLLWVFPLLNSILYLSTAAFFGGIIALGVGISILRRGPATWDRVKAGKTPSYFTQSILWICGLTSAGFGFTSVYGILFHKMKLVLPFKVWAFVIASALLFHTLVQLYWGNPHFTIGILFQRCILFLLASYLYLKIVLLCERFDYLQGI
jgi:hypothetical protein